MLEARSLTKVFVTAGGEELVAVERVSFSCRAGEIYGLLGPNGAGKTTTLRMLAGLMRPTSGEVFAAGVDMKAAPAEARRRIGYLAAGSGLYSRLTPRETMLYFGSLYGVPSPRLEARVEEIIDMLGMEAYADRRCEGLSTGETQRVLIGRTLVHDPEALILDEPTLGLDVLSNRVVLDFVRNQRARRKAVLISTHYLDEAESLCDRFGLLHRGRLLAEGTLDDLRSRFGRRRIAEIFLDVAGEPAGAAVSGEDRRSAGPEGEEERAGERFEMPPGADA